MVCFSFKKTKPFLESLVQRLRNTGGGIPSRTFLYLSTYLYTERDAVGPPCMRRWNFSGSLYTDQVKRDGRRRIKEKEDNEVKFGGKDEAIEEKENNEVEAEELGPKKGVGLSGTTFFCFCGCFFGTPPSFPLVTIQSKEPSTGSQPGLSFFASALPPSPPGSIISRDYSTTAYGHMGYLHQLSLGFRAVPTDHL